MNEIKAPEKVTGRPTLFLAGSIEMGTAVDWQQEAVKYFADMRGIVLNPRRDNWDASWEQSIDNPQFAEQVNWELDGLANCRHILFYFQPNTKSPITLMELGWALGRGHYSQNIAVVCQNGFWRKGNVDVMCTRYGQPVLTTLEAGLILTRRQVLTGRGGVI